MATKAQPIMDQVSPRNLDDSSTVVRVEFDLSVSASAVDLDDEMVKLTNAT